MLEDEVGRPISPGGQLHVVDLGPILSCDVMARHNKKSQSKDGREGCVFQKLPEYDTLKYTISI